MKKIIFFTTLLKIATATFSQQTNLSPTLTKQDYLQKSKKQKTAARIMLGAGGTLMIVSAFVVTDDVLGLFDPRDQKNGSLADGLAYTGTAVALASIPLFIAARKNKIKALSISFINEKAPQLQNNQYVYRAIPSLTLKISL